MGTEVKTDAEQLADKVAADAAAALAIATHSDGNEPAKPEEPKEDENEKLDAQAELFVRRVVDGLTKNLSDLLNPPKPAKKEPKTESKPEVKKQKPRNFMTFFGGK